MRKDFFTGLALLLPVIITIMIVVFVIKILTNPFMGAVSSALDYYDILNKPFLYLTEEQVLRISSRVLILIALFVVTLIIGMLGRMLLFSYFLKATDFIFHRIPLVNKVYRAVQDVMHTIFTNKESRFSEVVLVPFPHAKSKSIGLVTSHQTAAESDPSYSDLVSVFVPGTPNPAMGFMLLFKRDQLIQVDMKVSDAVKFIVSCGVILPNSQNQKDS